MGSYIEEMTILITKAFLYSARAGGYRGVDHELYYTQDQIESPQTTN